MNRGDGEGTSEPHPDSSLSSRGVADAASVAPEPSPEFRVLGAALTTSATGILPAFLVGALAVEMRQELALSPAGLGAAVSAFFLTAGVVAVVFGRGAGRWGWQRSMVVAAAGTTATLLAIAGLVSSLPGLLLAMVFGGLWHALAMPASNLAIARAGWRDRQGLSFGIRQAAVPATLMFAGLSVPLVALNAGWRWAFVSATLFPLSVLLAVPSSSVGSRAQEPDRRPSTDNQRMVSLAVAGGFAAAVAGALSAFFVLSAVEAGVDVATAGKLLAGGSVLVLAVRVIAGWAVDRFALDGFRSVVWLLALGSVGHLVLSSGHVPWIVFGVLIAFGAGWGWPGIYHFAVVDSNRGSPASATGIAQAGLSTGAAVGPLLFGFIVDQASFQAAWVGTAAVSVVAAVLIRRHLRADRVGAAS